MKPIWQMLILMKSSETIFKRDLTRSIQISTIGTIEKNGSQSRINKNILKSTFKKIHILRPRSKIQIIKITTITEEMKQ